MSKMYYKHEDKISDIFLRLQALVAEATPLSNECKMLALKLSHLEKNIVATHTEIDGIPPYHDDIDLVQQFWERVTKYKELLSTIYDSLILLELKEDDPLFDLHAKLKKGLFVSLHLTRRLLSNGDSPHAGTPATGKKVE